MALSLDLSAVEHVGADVADDDALTPLPSLVASRSSSGSSAIGRVAQPRATSLSSSPLRVVASPDAPEPLVRGRSASNASIRARTCAACAMPLDGLAMDARVRTFHESVCKHLRTLARDRTATLPTPFRRTPRPLVDVVFERLVAVRTTLPVDVLAFVIGALNDERGEARLLSVLEPTTLELLYPYYVERLRAAGLVLERVFDGPPVVLRLGFADDATMSVAAAIDAHDAHELALSLRHAPGYRRVPVAPPTLQAPTTRDLASVLVSTRTVVGMSFSDTLLVSHQLPRALTRLFTCITELRAARCGLVSLPLDLGALVHLRVLVVDENTIASVPSSAARLRSLECFSASKNALTELPAACVSGWRELRSLGVARNELTALPAAELAALPALRRIDAAENRLRDFPRALQTSTSLTFVSLMYNRPRFDVNEFSRADVERPDGAGGAVLVVARLRCIV